MEFVLSSLITTDATQKATIWKSHPQRQPPARGIHFILHSLRLILIPALRSCKYNLLNCPVIIMLWRHQCVTVLFGVYLQHFKRLLLKSKMCFSSGYVCNSGPKTYIDILFVRAPPIRPFRTAMQLKSRSWFLIQHLSLLQMAHTT